jgi:hypothetical protein
MADLTIPFIILLLIVIFLLINRSRFESDVKKQFEEELEKYKNLETKQSIQPKSKDLKGLVFETEGKVTVEVFDDTTKSKIERSKFELKDFQC